MKIRPSLCAILLPLLIGWWGCISSPEIEHPDLEIDPPDTWSSGADASGGIEEQWWTLFQDQDLNRTVHQVLDRNHELRSAAARVDQAALQARIAGADLMPRVSANFDARRTRQNFIGFPVGGGDDVISNTTTTYGVSLDTTWELDLWGRIRSEGAAARADYDASRAELHGAYLSLAGQAVKAWLAMGEAAQQLDLARETVDSYRRSLDQIRRRYEQGVRSSLDVRLASTSLADAEALVQLYQQQLDASRRQLQTLMGRYPDGSLNGPRTLPSVLPEVPAGLPAHLVSRRPDLAAAERRLAAAGARVDAARAALYPRISLTASGGTASEAIGDLLDGDYRVWSLLGNLTQPLFEGGRLLDNVERNRAAEEEAVANYTADLLHAYAEVETALQAERFLQARETLLGQAADHAEAARRLAEDRYRAGLEDYITVLESQRRALNNRSALLMVRLSRYENRVDLILALGGGFAGAMPDPLPAEENPIASAKDSAP